VPDSQLSNRDIVLDEESLHTHEDLLVFCVYSLIQAALQIPGAVDSDLVDALEALIQTHRTLESGLYYETRAQNTIAANIQRSFTASLADYQKLRTKREHLTQVRNSEILAMLVFLHRLAQRSQNGRPRSRMYMDLLRQMTPDAGVEAPSPSIIL
jgi:hypothetical protein